MTARKNQTTTEGAEAPQEGTVAAEQAAKGSDAELAQRRDGLLEQTATEGVLHDDGLLDRNADDYVGPVTVTEAAPQDVDTDPASSVQGNPEYTPDLPATMGEQKAPRFDKTKPEYAKGYVGTLPNEGNREDLTLAAAAERARADYGTGRNDA